MMSFRKGGRPMDPIWEFFSQTEINNKIVVECNSWKTNVSAKPYRIEEHHKKCNVAAINEHKQVSTMQLLEE